MSKFTELSLPLVVKLASIAVHADELTSPGGHDFDNKTIRSLLTDPDVAAFMADLDKAGFLPKKRS